MWINQILQGKEDKKHEEEAIENNPVQTRHLRKDPVHFTTDVWIDIKFNEQMFVNEDKELHVCINQYKLIKEVSVGINSRVYQNAYDNLIRYMLVFQRKIISIML